ncbi:MAG: hypothetical protein P4L10_11065 [Acidobacteriaceae bacterium]|nr:hypothetical protein [Acidobacteriaceae bacterium]
MESVFVNELPTPKFKMGQTVYLATTQSTEGQHDCPDCFGAKVWSVQSPAGLETTTPCPRCSRSYFSNDRNIPSLSYVKKAGAVRRLTIGSITAKTHPWRSGEHIEYMCIETGVGSGSTYYENRLFETEEEALTVAKLIAADEQKEIDAQPESLKKLEFGTFTCDLSAYALSWDAVYDAWTTARDYGEIVDAIIENKNRATSDHVEDLIYLRTASNPWRKDHPLKALVDAVADGNMDAARAAYDALQKPKINPGKILAENAL